MSTWNANDNSMLYVKIEKIEFKPNRGAVIELGIDNVDIEKLPRFADRHLGEWVHVDFDENRAMAFTKFGKQVTADD